MTRHTDRSIILLAAILTLAACAAFAAVAPPRAAAKSYRDVGTGQWAHAYIASVTNHIVDGHRLLDDFGSVFKPEAKITREHLARSLVLASGHYGQNIKAIPIKDVGTGHRYYSVIEMAVHLGYLRLDAGGYFRPDRAVTAKTAETAMVRWLRGRYSSYDWTLLSALNPDTWQPNAGWKTRAPAYLPFVVASRQLELRFEHTNDAQETVPNRAIDRAEIAYMFWRAYKVPGDWVGSGLGSYRAINFPPLSDRQKEVVRFALKWVGYPYIWGGEYPTRSSPYGYQKAGGFDCSGLVFFIMKMHFHYDSITVYQRGAHDMAAKAKPRITRAQLKPGDLIFFGPNGPRSTVISIYHAGLYLGNGWFIHSTGSSDGVTLQSLNTSSYYKSRFAWGRRVLTSGQLTQGLPAAALAAPEAVPAAEDPGAGGTAPAGPTPAAAPDQTPVETPAPTATPMEAPAAP